eukprot:1018608-Prymnesium_polylepis.1
MWRLVEVEPLSVGVAGLRTRRACGGENAGVDWMCQRLAYFQPGVGDTEDAEATIEFILRLDLSRG